MHLNDEEIVLLKAIIVLNPHIKHLSQEASEQCAELRDRIQETLYHVVRETHPKEAASSRFGNLLLFIPTIMILGNVMYENLQFVQSFGKQSIDPLLCELLDNIEPVDDARLHFYDDSNDLPMRPSTSSSSVSSLASQESLSSYSASEENTFDELATRHTLLSPQQSFDSSDTGESSGLTNACSLPNLDQVESDPDYNMTLTAEMFTGMRQAISAAQNMDIDGRHTPPNSPQFSHTPIATRPHFFLEDSARTTTIERFGSHHRFTITARRQSVDPQNISAARDEPKKVALEISNCRLTDSSPPVPYSTANVPSSNNLSSNQLLKDNSQAPAYGSYPGTQMPISKTLSYPYTIQPNSYTHYPDASLTCSRRTELTKPLAMMQNNDINNTLSEPLNRLHAEELQNGSNAIGYDSMDYY